MKLRTRSIRIVRASISTSSENKSIIIISAPSSLSSTTLSPYYHYAALSLPNPAPPWRSGTTPVGWRVGEASKLAEARVGKLDHSRSDKKVSSRTQGFLGLWFPNASFQHPTLLRRLADMAATEVISFGGDRCGK